MKWARGVHHVEALIEQCADMVTKPRSIFPLRVVALWAFGELLGEQKDVDLVPAALAVDLPVEDVPWLGRPVGAEQWAYATRLIKNPIRAAWRSAHAPVWNHEIVRPVLLWSVDEGTAEPAVAALRDGKLDELRPPAPTPEQFRDRLRDELRISLRTLRRASAEYENRRWRPGKLEPVADALWDATSGYLDVLDVVAD